MELFWVFMTMFSGKMFEKYENVTYNVKILREKVVKMPFTHV